MSNPYRDCLVELYEWAKRTSSHYYRTADVLDRTRILLAQPETEEADIHYAWELHDAEGDWQAGGTANSLEDVQREGNHYLQIYSQDGPHKLIFQRVSTIEEVTNA